MKKFILLLFISAISFHVFAGKPWKTKKVWVDAYQLNTAVTPRLEYDGDSIYTIRDWYGVKGYDLQFKTITSDTTVIEVTNDYQHRNNYYYVYTGLEDLPIATVYSAYYKETKTVCSGFWGNQKQGNVWAYVYLYDKNKHWVGGHLYKLAWGKEPPRPIWKVKGHATLVGNVPGIETEMEAYADGRYIIKNWYGVDHYDFEFCIRPDGGIKALDYYWVEGNEYSVQTRRDDIYNATITQNDSVPNGGFTGDKRHGKVWFHATAYADESHTINDTEHPNYVFEW